MRRAPVRWRSPFGEFIARYTVSRLVSALRGRGVSVTRGAVYAWVSGRTRPRPDAARAIVSASQGEIRYEDIYRPHSREDPGAP